MVDHRFRPAWAEIDVGAIRHNAAVLAAAAAPAQLCAVVKADGYGHGSIVSARAAIAGGATWLAVALVEEGVALREAGIDVPILLLSEPVPSAMAEAVAQRLVPTLYSDVGMAALSAAVRHGAASGPRSEPSGPVAVHLKIDTGMHRVGADPSDAVRLADAIANDPGLRLHGVWTHLAVADGIEAIDTNFTTEQMVRFESVLVDLAKAGHHPDMVHVANSAGTIAYAEARRDLVRCGIALYGAPPSSALASMTKDPLTTELLAALRPALSLRAHVSHVQHLPSGERPSYGRRRALDGPSVVATIPMGYADGVPRRLFDCGGTVLIGGVRRPLAGVITMDQIVVDCGPAASSWAASSAASSAAATGGPSSNSASFEVHVGDEVVFLGRQGDEEITATEWAELLGTISYEVLCGIGPRVPRVIVGESLV